MKLGTDNIVKSLDPILGFGRKYLGFIILLLFLGIYVFLVQYIGGLIQDEPSQAAIDSELKPVSRLKVDEQALQQITELESQNIDVQALFDQARQNPFTE